MRMTKLTRARALLLAAGALCLGAAGAEALASSAPSVTCDGVLPAGTYQDVTVPASATCSINASNNIQHDLKVLSGGSVVDFGATVGHDLTADRPVSMEIGGVSGGVPGHVGHDIRIAGLTGAGAVGYNYVCNQVVGHDLVVQDGLASAGETFVGDPGVVNGNLYGCGNQVGHDLAVQNNADSIDVSNNNPTDFENPNAGVSHDLVVKNNTGGATVNANTVGHDCSQSADSPYTGTGNVAGHSNDCNATY